MALPMCLESTTPLEEWRPVVGYEGIYEVSNLGRVKRIRTATCTQAGLILRTNPQWHGYHLVSLYLSGVQKVISVHRVVARVFHGPCSDGHEVNHIDGDKANNAASNLEYITRAQNLAHADQMGLTRRGVLNGKAKLTDDDIRLIRSAPTTHGMQSILARRYGVRQGVIWNIINRKAWKHVT
jgi:hypothetical protein